MRSSFLFLFALLASTLTYAQQLDHQLGELLVQLEPGANPKAVVEKFQRIGDDPTEFRLKQVVSEPLRIFLFSFDFDNIHENRMRFAVEALPEVTFAQFNHLLEERQTTPDDPDYGLQWWHNNTGQTGGTVGADIDTDLAWDLTTGGTTANGDEIVVCVVENADRTHEDLQGNLWFNPGEIPDNGIDDDNNGYVDDWNGWNVGSNNDNITPAGHGTAVSGIIGAVGNNTLGVTGVNWDVKIMHVDYGFGLTEANVVAGYTYPYVQRRRYNETNGAEGAFVVATNSSWGIDGGDPADAPIWCSFYDSLGVVGILSCGATANNNVDIDVVGDLPTACDSDYMISVTATNHNDVRTFSGFGATTVDLGAPGEDVYLPTTNNGYANTSGTSFATPATAGVIALMYSAPCGSLGAQAIGDPQGTADLIRDALFAGVDPVPNLTTETVTGGRVNAFNAINLVLQNCGPCPAPFGINVENVTDVSADLTYVTTDSTISTDLRFRVQGDTVWADTVEMVTSPYSFTGLMSCTTYEVELFDFCADTTSGWSNTFVFKTDGCCEAPGEVSVDLTSDTTATVFWSDVLAANSYNVQLTNQMDQTTVLIENLPGDSLDLTGLLACTEYEVALQTVCDTGATNFSLPVAFKTTGCGACTDFDYCASEGDDSSFEWIEGITLGDYSNQTGDNDGYAFFEDEGITLATNNAYNFALDIGYANIEYEEWITVHIDLDQDGTFDDVTERVFDTGELVTNAASGLIIIPDGAAVGLTRMRVTMRWNAEPVVCDESFDYGEVEDYCIDIVVGTAPVCLVPDAPDTLNVNFQDATLTWNSVPSAFQYNLQYRPVGSTNWETVMVSDTTVSIDGLQDCTTYEAQVESVCVGTTSGYSDLLTFTTDCLPPCAVPDSPLLQEATFFAATLGWDAASIAESYNFRYRVAGTDPWIELNTTDTQITIEQLQDCTDYEAQLENVCLGGVSGYSLSTFFATECLPVCDQIPQNLDTLSVTATSLFITWDPVDIAESYTLRFRAMDSGDAWTEFQSGNNTETVGSLEECGVYEFQVRANCLSGEGEFGESSMFETLCTIDNQNLELVRDFRLFPNPMTHAARVELNAPGLNNFRFRLTDATGKLVRDREVPSAFNIERGDLAPGIYFYQITADAAHVATGRLVIL